MSNRSPGHPRLIIAGTSSGCGKTTIATGLMAALSARGIPVAAFKVGPDFIDPSFHALATGRPARNLDVFLSGEELIAPLLRNGAAGAQLSLIEGVMGLFDGVSGAGDRGSTAQVAHLIDAPVVLVIDANAMARSAAAVVHGFASFDPELRLAGVILNRVGSPGHAELLRDALEALELPILGVVYETDAAVAPERHLGLVPASETPARAARFVAAAQALVEASCELDELVRLARSVPALECATWSPQTGEPAGLATIAVAGGAAFSFRYAENMELLEHAGATLASFDPLNDTQLPEGATGLYLGGGFPEQFVAELSANVMLRDSIAAFARAGRPLIAECGGLLYLLDELDARPLCGVINAKARISERLAIAYHEATACADSALVPAGATLKAHEFHRTETTPACGSRAAWRLEGTAGSREEGFLQRRVHASYLHTHWAATPEVARRFVTASGAVTASAPD